MPESISNSVEALLTAVADVPLAELPHLLGQLREAEARAPWHDYTQRRL